MKKNMKTKQMMKKMMMMMMMMMTMMTMMEKKTTLFSDLTAGTNTATPEKKTKRISAIDSRRHTEREGQSR